MLLRNTTSFVKLKPVLAIGFLFSASSLLFGTWVASIPGIKYRLGFTDGTLGLSLLLSPLGALTGVVLSPRIFSKIPVGKWMFGAYILLCFIMILQINSTSRILLWLCLYFFGLISFLNGVSSNATVNLLEKKYQKRLMSTCHAMYSLGGGVSAVLAAFFFTIHVPSGWQIVVIAACIIIIIRLNRHHLLSHQDILHTRSKLKLPSLSILGISFICMIVFMVEGCVADWSAIYLRESLHAAKEFISLGYAGFSAAMTLGRLNGDSLITRLGSKRIVMAGSLLAAAGFLLVVLAPGVMLAVTGYVLVGFGCSCIVPVLFSASANIPGVSAVEGFAMVTTGGLIGFLTGPSVIGFISEKTSLSTGLSLLILLAIAAAIAAWKNKFLAGKKPFITRMPYDEQIY